MGRLLLLASASPQRRLLLKRLGVPFRVEPSRVSERSRQTDPKRLVLELALRKAKSVARRNPSSPVLGADTIVVCRGRILLKPRSARESARILSWLNGRVHRVWTGVALVLEGGRRSLTEAVKSKVRARRLKPEELSRLAGKHMDKAGAYAVQDKDDPFIEAVEGDFDNVIGLPLAAVRRLLRRSGAYKSSGCAEGRVK